MGDLRLGQKLVNYFRFGEHKIDNEDIWRRITTMEDDEFQRILDVTIFAPPSSDLRIANYQKLLNVRDYDRMKKRVCKNCGHDKEEHSDNTGCLRFEPILTKCQYPECNEISYNETITYEIPNAPSIFLCKKHYYEAKRYLNRFEL